MCPDSGLTPEDDIQQALQQAQTPMASESADMETTPGEVMAETHACPLMGVRYAMAKCSLMAEKYPWQTTVALLMCAGCAWICSYFGATMMVAMVLYAVYGED